MSGDGCDGCEQFWIARTAGFEVSSANAGLEPSQIAARRGDELALPVRGGAVVRSMVWLAIQRSMALSVSASDMPAEDPERENDTADC